jgi:hypothetical protein
MPMVCTFVSLFCLLVGNVAAAPAAPPANSLTAAQKKAGWRLLFDGTTSAGWRLFNGEKFPEGWTVKDGMLSRQGTGRHGDLVTTEEFDNFELTFDWRLAEGGNSGLKYLVDESLVKDGNSGLGFEYQILDDDKHPDAKKGVAGNRTTGSLYDLIPPAPGKTVRPPGQWNEARLLVKGNHIEHWLNGKKTLEFERGSPALKALIAESKYKEIAGFGQASKGRILFQDHGDNVSFRNIRIRSIKSK